MKFRKFSPEKYSHPLWQKKRLEILQRDGFHCQFCFSDDSTLHVHHKDYPDGGELWDVPNDWLITLCKDCHETQTKDEKELRRFVRVRFGGIPASSVQGLFLEIAKLIFERVPYPDEVGARAVQYAVSKMDGKTEVSEYFSRIEKTSATE